MCNGTWISSAAFKSVVTKPNRTSVNSCFIGESFGLRLCGLFASCLIKDNKVVFAVGQDYWSGASIDLRGQWCLCFYRFTMGIIQLPVKPARSHHGSFRPCHHNFALAIYRDRGGIPVGLEKRGLDGIALAYQFWQNRFYSGSPSSSTPFLLYPEPWRWC